MMLMLLEGPADGPRQGASAQQHVGTMGLDLNHRQLSRSVAHWQHTLALAGTNAI